jgi:hypothetical protein
MGPHGESSQSLTGVLGLGWAPGIYLCHACSDHEIAPPPRSPITEYCVEHLVAPQTDPLPGGDGFAQCEAAMRAACLPVQCAAPPRAREPCDCVAVPRGSSHRDTITWLA